MSGFVGRPGIMDWEVAEELLDNARGYFSLVDRGFDARVYDTAAKNLRRYRNGQGGLEEYSDGEIAGHPALLEAEDANRTRFETRTFTGRTGNSTLNAELLDLPDGESRSFGDDWAIRVPWSQPSTYLAFGGTSVASRGEFTARRNDDVLTIRGVVGHGFGNRERFDFHAFQPGSDDAAMLEGAGEAAPFQMAYDRYQEVEAEPRYEPDGSLILRRATWGAIR